MSDQPKYPGIRLTTNGNTLVSYYTEARITDGGVFYPITPSTEMGEHYQLSFAEGNLNVFGRSRLAIETEGEHAAQAGAIALSTTGKRVVNFTSGQGLVYGLEQYYHAPGKMSTMIVELGARALTKTSLNVHCGHDDFYAALDTGWIMLFSKDAQQAADQAIILRKVTEQSLTPGINAQDGFLTTHLERTFLKTESECLREFLGAPDDIIECPTDAQRELFGPTRPRVPAMIDLKNPVLIGSVQNQEHYMNGVIARRDNFYEPILKFMEDAYKEFGDLTGRRYGLVSPYKTEDAEVVFLSIGSAAENIEAAVDYLRETRGAKVGSVHVNVIRPFPVAALVNVLKGKKACIILERTDEPLAGDNPLAREVRAALTKSYVHPGFPHREGYPTITYEDVPRNFSGVYGMGSRDFRPEHIIGAYEYVVDGRTRQDGKGAKDGQTFFYLGVNHPYSVCSDDAPSLLPDHAIAVRLHSIGGWGMITTGKNLSEIIGEFGDFIADRDNVVDEQGNPKEVLHVSANPKYGSEKKGAPTSYFLIVAPERIRVNCDLQHVNAVLCCDPKAFLHTNPLVGITEGGAFVWESDETPEDAWKRIPKARRQEIIDKKIRVFILDGFKIAREATNRPDLQLRMQGNAFLGAFFAVSTFLKDNNIGEAHFHEVVRAQYVKKFGRFGEAVVDSNMDVMRKGFEQVQEVKIGKVDAPDTSSMRGQPIVALNGTAARGRFEPLPEQPSKAPIFRTEFFDKEFRAGLGYHQPASPLAAAGVLAAATGATASKYVARRETPVFIPENCTQCMECIAVCPDTALPNTAQDVGTVLETVFRGYVSEVPARDALLNSVTAIEEGVRAKMLDAVKAKQPTPFADVVLAQISGVAGVTDKAREELAAIMKILPLAYSKTNAIFASKEKKEPGSGGLFSIFVADLCKGCGECVVACGDHNALRMEPDSEEINTEYASARGFLELLPETDQKYLGLYDSDRPEDSKAAALRNHLMVRRNYEALVSGDGACAGCGEKTVLHSVASVTEAYMRPIFHARADRLDGKVEQLKKEGVAKLKATASSDKDRYELLRRGVAHIVMGLGGESPEDTTHRLENHAEITDEQIVDALAAVMHQDAFNHRDLQAVDGRLANGMCVMAMGANTGCNTVYGSTPPNNPHPYPWINSLFQDGATITWILGESFIQDHARRSVTPERLTDVLLEDRAFLDRDYYELTHFTDALMTDLEIREMPKVWAIGGDGGMGDIGFQNCSKVMLQNRPNVKLLMLDTQVYSNTGGQNSDSSPMTGGFDMNQFGEASQGKLTEMKSLAEIFSVGHGSPYVAQVSMANAAKLYKALLDALEYRGAAFFQCYTSCQPEHGIGDDMSTIQAQRVRDSRGLPEFIFNSAGGEIHAECLDLKGNPTIDRDWWQARYADKETYNYTVAHWATTEARFRRHVKNITEDAIADMIHLDELLVRITQNDVVYRRFTDPEHRAFIPDFGSYIVMEDDHGKRRYVALSRHMVLYCVERRKSWRLLQSRAGIVNLDYKAQQALLKKVDSGQIELQDFLNRTKELYDEELQVIVPAKKKPAMAGVK